jgi:serine/threonine protein kinase
MQFVHSHSVVHRGLKPSNILINECCCSQIGDVWTRCLLDVGASHTISFATRLYMTPEMYENCEYTAAINVFSFALILCELLAGDSVFSPKAIEPALMKQIFPGQCIQ